MHQKQKKHRQSTLI